MYVVQTDWSGKFKDTVIFRVFILYPMWSKYVACIHSVILLILLQDRKQRLLLYRGKKIRSLYGTAPCWPSLCCVRTQRNQCSKCLTRRSALLSPVDYFGINLHADFVSCLIIAAPAGKLELEGRLWTPALGARLTSSLPTRCTGLVVVVLVRDTPSRRPHWVNVFGQSCLCWRLIARAKVFHILGAI